MNGVSLFFVLAPSATKAVGKAKRQRQPQTKATRGPCLLLTYALE